MVSAQNLPVFPFHSGGKSASFLQLPHMVSRGISPCPNSLWLSWGWCWLLAVPKHTKAAVPVACALDETPVFTCVSARVQAFTPLWSLLRWHLSSKASHPLHPISYFINFHFQFTYVSVMYSYLFDGLPSLPHHPTTHTQMLGNKGFYGIKGFDYIQISS